MLETVSDSVYIVSVRLTMGAQMTTNDPRKRDMRIAIKVTVDVYDYLAKLAETRGLSMSALCASIVGTYKEQQENQREAMNMASLAAQKYLLENVDLESLVVRLSSDMDSQQLSGGQENALHKADEGGQN